MIIWHYFRESIHDDEQQWCKKRLKYQIKIDNRYHQVKSVVFFAQNGAVYLYMVYTMNLQYVVDFRCFHGSKKR
jgi:hypothetical protein